MSNSREHEVLVICKGNAVKIGKTEIKRFEGTLSRNETLGVLVVPNRNGYTDQALLYARSSPFKLLLTNIYDLECDF
ncbi:5273_t:CDS:2 [Acaulospora morrowiae]|uniref:5273_t:CDS:1 n=1 Tax=Acaulospora morrowiae TaxID=94023 RepID=A0A9N9EZZ2_9GLOM|nr:5273_t:CDS:2 [Acaulospora morrowiae]